MMNRGNGPVREAVLHFRRTSCPAYCLFIAFRLS
jgi:hypothetical protein